MNHKLFFITIIAILIAQHTFAKTNPLLKTNSPSNSIEFERVEFGLMTKSTELNNSNAFFHNDSIHRFNFRYKDKKRGIKPFIAPTLLIATGTVLLVSPNANENFQNWVQDNFAYTGHADDYLQYVPGVAVYALNLFGVKGKNNFGNRTAIVIKSLLINDLMVSSLKTWVNSERPNGDSRSFPSGHTSVAFAMAHFMHKEFGERSIWYSLGAYTCAASVGLMRVAKNAHWISDVVAGAGFGMLSTELVYLTHLYKWDNEHIKNFDIFPWRSNRQTGLTMVYTF